MNEFVEVVRKYAVFSGRARRREYWFFVLIYTLISVVLMLLDGILGTSHKFGDTGLLGALFGLALLLPSIAVSVRRLHDTDRSAWWLLIALIPLLGVIVLLVFCAMDSQPGDNRFGPNPKLAA
jgi:uncharacterized membrane protein YhaH (DUF805 family)